ncbi:MAG: hypothetical protein H6834_09885 [Planctomycetes bacterium]|nr:hypothetical protein [Planctomycetota bacterium]
MLALLASLAVSFQDPPAHAQDALHLELGPAIEAPTPVERASRAAELANGNVPLEHWLASLRTTPPPNQTLRRGRVHRFDPVLHVADQGEKTPIHVYVPASYDPAREAPLVIAFHGTGGSGEGLPLMWREVADALGMIVAAPSEVGPNDGYHFSDRERESALETIRFLKRAFPIDDRRIHLTGISRGGHLAWDLALRYPNRWASIAPMIGGPRLNIAEGQNNLRFFENVLELPIRDLQGARDDPRLIFNLKLAFRKLEEAGARDARLVLFEDRGHSFDLAAVDWKAHFETIRRPERPQHIVHTLARLAEGRNAWIQVTQFGRGVENTFRPKVKQKTWEALDDEGRRAFLLDEAIDRNARLEIEMVEPGRFVAKGKGVTAFELYLEPDMFVEDEPVRVTFQGRTRKLRVVPSSEVLLTTYVQDLDRTFLPVAKVTVR